MPLAVGAPNESHVDADSGLELNVSGDAEVVMGDTEDLQPEGVSLLPSSAESQCLTGRPPVY